MLNYLRPHSKRQGSPASTAPPQHYSFIPQGADTRRFYHDRPTSARRDVEHSNFGQVDKETEDVFTQSPSVPNLPPVLPPIPRVASRHESLQDATTRSTRKDELEQLPRVSERSGQSGSSSSVGVQRSTLDTRRSETRQSGLHEDQDVIRPTMRTRQQTDPYGQNHDREPATLGARESEPFLERRRLGLRPTGQSLRREKPLPQKPPQDDSVLVESSTIQNSSSNTAIPSAKQGKTRTYLRNPMSLLQKRRPPQNVSEAINDRYAGYAKSEVPDFDPRIRGKIVHDFNAPRPMTNHSQAEITGLSGNGDSSSSGVSGTLDYKSIETNGEESPGRQHLPVFRENFQEEKAWNPREQDPMRQPKSAALYQLAMHPEIAKVDASSLPPFARNISSSYYEDGKSSEPTPQPNKTTRREPTDEPDVQPIQQSSSVDNTSLPTPPPKPHTYGSPGASPNFQASLVPKHAKSTSSRFSFDLGGKGSESLLEEKHREHVRLKEKLSGQAPPEEDDEEEAEEDIDALENDEGLEERIPGVNADDDDGLLEDPVPSVNIDLNADDKMVEHRSSDDTGSTNHQGLTISTQGTDSLHFASPERSSFATPASVVSTECTLPDTPRDDQGNVIGFAYTKSSPNLVLPLFHDSRLDDKITKEGQAISPDSRYPHVPFGVSINPAPPTNQISNESDSFSEDKDYYCDDDLMDEINEASDGEIFDESLLDDETGLYRLPRRYEHEGHHRLEAGLQDPQPGPDVDGNCGTPEAPQRQSTQRAPSLNATKSEKFMITEEYRDQMPNLQPQSQSTGTSQASLTQNNLQAYHNALALAATQAESKGRFRRSSMHSDVSEGVARMPLVKGPPIIHTEEPDDDFDYDDAVADDPIIAEANAEALENDDEGFYGQEFGFYAKGNSKAEYANGGYFGPQAASIYRSCSGRANFQEPNLTPITERSEFVSNRNSAISLAMYGFPSAGLPLQSPGLAQLAAMGGGDGDNSPTYSNYLKLKRMAFGGGGGSNVSLQSSSGNSGSPSHYLPPQGFIGNQSNPNIVNLSPQNMASSFQSFSSSKESEGSPASDGSPTVTLANANNRFPQISTNTPASIPASTNAPNFATNPAVSAPTPTVTHTSAQSPSTTIPQNFHPPPFKPQQHTSAPPRTSTSTSTSLMPPPPTAPSTTKILKNINTHHQNLSSHSRNSSTGAETSISYTQEPDEPGKRGSGKWIVEKRRLGEDGVQEVLGREVVEAGAI